MKRRNFMVGTLAGGALATINPWFTFALAAEENTKIKQGGKMTVSYKNDPGTLDPAIGYNWQNWPMMRALFSRLLGYEPGTTNLTTEAAQSWHVSDDGKRYLVVLRTDVKFYDGTPVTAHDVKFSLERVIDPKTASPGQSFYSSLDGFAEASRGEASEVKGIQVLDEHKIEFTLSSPDAAFPQVLALNFSSIVKPDAVRKYGSDFAHHPVGSGAFFVEQYNPGNSIVWKRNPHYFVSDLPYLDEIKFNIGVSPLTAFFQLIRGQNDFLGDGIPGSQLARVQSESRYHDLIVKGHPLETSYLTMNTQMAPFDDVRVRQAINMAINKKHVVQVINGRGRPTNQILPPGMPGYDAKYKGYSYDIDKAQTLLAEAGHKDGFKTQLFAMNTAPEPKIAQAIQADLKKIGVEVELRLLSQAQIISIAGSPNQAPMVWSGGLAWQDDFPDPSDFYGPILSSSSAIKGGWNWAFFKDKDTDEMAEKANRMYKPSQRQQRMTMWKNVFSKVMDKAPWVPIYNKISYRMHSSKVGGNPNNVFVDPAVVINYAYIYATGAQS